MTLEEALAKLNIEDYRLPIIESNSHGELFHCADYICLAEQLSDKDITTFREWFIAIVEWANSTWDRPSSIYQYIITCWNESKIVS